LSQHGETVEIVAAPAVRQSRVATSSGAGKMRIRLVTIETRASSARRRSGRHSGKYEPKRS
jgi:hypothetical protein